MLNYKVSIIIPIYNIKKYLRKCVLSVIKQTYKNIEIILVNDGSTDGCLEICKDLSLEDNRIVLINKKNGGLSDARNFGIKSASGDYLFFLDGDDFIADDTIETLVDLVNIYKCDIAAIGYYIYYNDKNFKKNEESKKKIVLNKEEAIDLMINRKSSFGWEAWGKLYRKKLFENISFPKGKLYEDLGTTYKAILQSNKIAYYSIAKYFYVQNPKSITKTSSFNLKEMARIELSDQMCDDIEKQISSKELKRKLEVFRTFQYIAVINIMIKSDVYNKELVYQTSKKIKKNLKYILNYGTKKQKIQAISYRIGFNIYKTLFKILKNK